MNILTVENKSESLDTLPETLENQISFCVLDNSNQSDVDYFFIPLFMLEACCGPAVKLRVGKHSVKVPTEWNILIGDPEVGDLEALPITSINDRGFKAFQFNPLKGFRPSFLDVDIEDYYPETSWLVPELKNGCYLCVPLTEGDNPECIYFIKRTTKATELVDFNQVF
jgi:hypothetical protein